MRIKGNSVFLTKGKHGKNNSLPSLEDIKDGLLKMILFTNLEDVKIASKNYNAKPVLKLTIENHFDPARLRDTQKKELDLLKKEAKVNNFEVKII